MRIAINAQLVSSDRSYRNAGVSRYVRNMIVALSRVDRRNDYVVFLSHGIRPFVEQSNFRFVVTGVRQEWPSQRIFWEQVMLPLLLRRYGIELLHSTMNVMPLACPCASVVTIHDLSFSLVAETHASRMNLYHDVAKLADAMLLVAADGTVRHGLVDKSLQQARKFSWRRAAESTLAVYESVSSGGRRHAERSRVR